MGIYNATILATNENKSSYNKKLENFGHSQNTMGIIDHNIVKNAYNIVEDERKNDKKIRHKNVLSCVTWTWVPRPCCKVGCPTQSQLLFLSLRSLYSLSATFLVLRNSWNSWVHTILLGSVDSWNVYILLGFIHSFVYLSMEFCEYLLRLYMLRETYKHGYSCFLSRLSRSSIIAEPQTKP